VPLSDRGLYRIDLPQVATTPNPQNSPRGRKYPIRFIVYEASLAMPGHWIRKILRIIGVSPRMRNASTACRCLGHHKARPRTLVSLRGDARRVRSPRALPGLHISFASWKIFHRLAVIRHELETSQDHQACQWAVGLINCWVVGSRDRCGSTGHNGIDRNPKTRANIRWSPPESRGPMQAMHSSNTQGSSLPHFLLSADCDEIYLLGGSPRSWP
jgi:hypothetical protein